MGFCTGRWQLGGRNADRRRRRQMRRSFVLAPDLNRPRSRLSDLPGKSNTLSAATNSCRRSDMRGCIGRFEAEHELRSPSPLAAESGVHIRRECRRYSGNPIGRANGVPRANRFSDSSRGTSFVTTSATENNLSPQSIPAAIRRENRIKSHQFQLNVAVDPTKRV